jgi:hypothetical protein
MNCAIIHRTVFQDYAFINTFSFILLSFEIVSDARLRLNRHALM